MLIDSGLVVFARHECPTCTLIEPVLRAMAAGAVICRIVSQDDPSFPAGVAGVIDDRELDHSFLNRIETVPTLLRFEHGREAERVKGWDREAWRRLTGIAGLGAEFPVFRPG